MKCQILQLARLNILVLTMTSSLTVLAAEDELGWTYFGGSKAFDQKEHIS